MRAKISIISLISLLIFNANIHAQSSKDITKSTREKYQAKAPPTHFFGIEAFKSSVKTEIRWLGGAGFLINSWGTTFMVDPVLEGFDMPLLIEEPIKADEVPNLDAVLVTHSDNDHYSVPTCRKLSTVCKQFHSTQYVDSLMKNEGLRSFGHNIGEVFSFGDIRVTLTPADHAYQN